MKTILFLATGGVLGVLLRHGVSVLVMRSWGGSFPLHTFLINASGSFLIGMIYVFSIEATWLRPEHVRIGLMTGFLGGFTTFSSFSLETVRLLESGHVGLALAYVALSNGCGIVFAYAGILLARFTAL